MRVERDLRTIVWWSLQHVGDKSRRSEEIVK